MSRQKTTFVNKGSAERGWVIIDVDNHVVGRAASQIADILRGKHKPGYTPNGDAGDFVVVVNAAKLRFTGNKLHDKEYFHHTGYFGGIKSITAEKQLQRHPDRVLRDAVWGMLPKNTLSRSLINKLKIYADTEHPHSAQNPVAVKIEGKL